MRDADKDFWDRDPKDEPETNRVRVWEENGEGRQGYLLIAMPNMHLFAFDDPPKLEPYEAPLMDGTVLRQGDCISASGGRKTCSGFVSWWFDPGAGLVYRGACWGSGIREGGNRLLCFEHYRDGALKPVVFEGRLWCYWGWTELDPKVCGPGMWHFTSPECASRVVETLKVRRDTLPWLEALTVPRRELATTEEGQGRR